MLLDFYKSLIKLRRDIPALSYLDKECIEVFELENKKTFSIQRWKDGSEVYLLFNFDNNNIKFTPSLTKGSWEKIFDSSEKIWNGPGTFLQKIISQGDELTVRGLNFVLYIKSGEM